ncbi:hypothetical protein [Hymenobacter glacieicola]|uniref:Uncharacterized protein n=1 Tax=Hymenobacter glacieicola TaxID=1562124 RepID=A0ABQ1X555_9BACT|nr:hypothetical protein [Hymenobacter glacieicola]GGG60495.1 hypothetical protein GCM10011378_40630 [Hymenobacter glacieicola]
MPTATATPFSPGQAVTFQFTSMGPVYPGTVVNSTSQRTVVGYTPEGGTYQERPTSTALVKAV